MMRRFLLPMVLIAGGMAAWGQDKTVPAKAPEMVSVQGRGVQIYQCEARENGGFGWMLLAPEAKLYDAAGAEVGTHGAGPRWTMKDGSAVVGSVEQKVDSPDAGNLPWLLLSVLQVGNDTGALAKAAWVRRSDTHGGVMPVGGCDQQHLSAVARIDYTATYTFYGGAVGK